MRTSRTALRAAALGVLTLVGLQLLPFAAAGASTAGRQFDAARQFATSSSTVDRILRDNRIPESSGLVASRRTSGVLWTHNDSGNASALYAVGRTGATVGTAKVRGVSGIDWEALAPVTGRDGSRLLAIGDIGDNEAARSQIEVDVVPEPAATRSSRISPVRVISLRYPSGPADAEALLADPRNGRLYVVTKGLFTSTIYAVPDAAWPGGAGTGQSITATLQPVARVNLTLVTDGAVLPDGRVVLRTYSTLAVLAPLSPPGAASGGDTPTVSPLATLNLPAQQQGESLAVLDAAAGVLLIGSEGVSAPILRLTVPADLWQSGAAPASTSAASSGGSQPTGAGAGTGTGADAGAGAGAGAARARPPKTGSRAGRMPGRSPWPARGPSCYSCCSPGCSTGFDAPGSPCRAGPCRAVQSVRCSRCGVVRRSRVAPVINSRARVTRPGTTTNAVWVLVASARAPTGRATGPDDTPIPSEILLVARSPCPGTDASTRLMPSGY